MKTLLFILLALAISNKTLKAEPLTGQAKVDSLLAELPRAKGDTNEVLLLIEISDALNNISPDEGKKYALKGIKLSKKINWDKGLSTCYTSLGVNFYKRSELPKAIEYFQKALKINKIINNKIGIASNIGNIGAIYLEKSKYSEALEHFEEALQISEEIGDMPIAASNIDKIGILYKRQAKFPKALEFFFKSLKIYEKLEFKEGIANSLGNVGVVYAYQENYPKAIEYFEKALKLNEEIGDLSGAANVLGNIGSIYGTQKNYPKALEKYQSALKIRKETGNKAGVAILLGNIGSIYDNQKNYPKALENYQNALKINKEIGNELLEAFNLRGIGEVYLNLSRDTILSKIKYESQYISINKEINLNKSIAYLSEAATHLEEIDGSNILIETYKYLQQAFELKGNYKKSLSFFKKFTVLQDSIFSQEKNNKIAALEKAREDDVNRIKIEKQEVQLAAQESEKMFIIYSGIGIVAFVVAILVLIAYQRKKSDKLLYNVLPISIAKRLKKKEHPISDHFDQASIIFIDIVGFTAMSKDSDPTDIVQALNKVFTHYDSIASKHGLEKIKTIGDCYMAAAGIPEIQKDNTLRAARMAIEVRDYMVDYYTDHGFKLDVRIGLDCGPVVAGVIGEKKFIYDMWSDAVNTASRMESTGQSGSVHISERFKEAVEEFDEFEFVERGEIDIKGKGKMKTFFMGSRETEVV